MKLTLSALALSIFAFGCGSSNSGPKGAPWCITKYEVSDFKIGDAKSKTELKDETVLNLTEGEYELKELDVFFVDTNRDLRVHVAYTFDNDGKATPSIKCVGSDSAQIKPGMDEYIYQMDVFTKMIVDSSGKSRLADGTAIVEFKDQGPEKALLTADFIHQDTPASEKNLKDTFKDGFNKTEQVLLTYDKAYEMQNKLEGNGIRVESRHVWRQ